MSNVPPPPPPPFGGGVPSSPPPNPGNYTPPPAYTPPPSYAPQPGYGQYPQPPAGGYQAYPQAPGTARIESVTGLRTATIVAFWTVTAATAFVSYAAFARRSTWDDAINGNAGFDELDSADSLVGAAVLLSWVAQLFAVIMLCLWAGKVVRNAQARGVQGVSPGLAIGGWFIPVGWLWLGFAELRKSVKGLNRSAPALNGWQASFIVAIIGSIVVYFVRVDINDFGSADDVSSALSRQGIVSAAAVVLFVIATLFATKATKQIGAAVTEA